MAQDYLMLPAVRRDAMDKSSGRFGYVRDEPAGCCLHAALAVSQAAHARILSLDLTRAWEVPGVMAIVTGADCELLTGPQIKDMPVLARGVARYCGEPLALVVASELWQARRAADRIEAAYDTLPAALSLAQALSSEAPLVHPELTGYVLSSKEVYPKAGTNIVQHVKVRRGNMEEGWQSSEVIVEGCFQLPQAAHSYMETRCAQAEIRGDGTVVIRSATQGPHHVRQTIADLLKLSQNQVIVEGYPVGGAYGGKVNPHPELLAWLASRAAGGRQVRLAFTRQQCFTTVGCRIGAECDLRLGAGRDGRIMALEAECRLDTGGYADSGPRMAHAVASSMGEPYAIGHIKTDALCVYTNHVYATSFRGFGHEISTFCMERMMDKLAAALSMDPAKLRQINLNSAGGFAPTGVILTASNYGDPKKCLEKAGEMIGWGEGPVVPSGPHTVRAKGLACFTKTSSSPTDASSGAVVIFCPDGSVNIQCGAVECGQGIEMALRQIAAEYLHMDLGRISISDHVDTAVAPMHWKTVASMTTFLAGNAVLAALEDAAVQLKRIGAVALRCQESHLEVSGEKVFQPSDPASFIWIKDLAGGIQFEDGKAIGGQIIGRGSYMMENLSRLDKETGQGRSGPFWTPGAQGVEVEYDTRDHTFRLLRAVTAVDAGRVINPAICRGQITGAMHMGLSAATREHFVYDGRGRLAHTSFRTYKLLHFGENPLYDVAFVETPNLEGPYGHRGLGEHGILGIGAALANALSRAMGAELDELPLTFDTLWRKAPKTGGMP